MNRSDRDSVSLAILMNHSGRDGVSLAILMQNHSGRDGVALAVFSITGVMTVYCWPSR